MNNERMMVDCIIAPVQQKDANNTKQKNSNSVTSDTYTSSRILDFYFRGS